MPMTRDEAMRALIRSALRFAGTMNVDAEPKAAALVIAGAAILREAIGPTNAAAAMLKLTGAIVRDWLAEVAEAPSGGNQPPQP